jgi:hypothetical protein
VAVENYHLPDESRAQRFSDFPSLIKGFKKIFSAELTRKIIVSLASDALKASAKVPGPPDTIAENERPIVIGQLIDDGTPYCMVNFLGVAGFVSIDTLKELAQQPDTKGSAYTKLDEKYVVALDYLGQIRMSLTESEMKKLLSNAKQVLQEY